MAVGGLELADIELQAPHSHSRGTGSARAHSPPVLSEKFFSRLSAMGLLRFENNHDQHSPTPFSVCYPGGSGPEYVPPIRLQLSSGGLARDFIYRHPVFSRICVDQGECSRGIRSALVWGVIRWRFLRVIKIHPLEPLRWSGSFSFQLDVGRRCLPGGFTSGGSLLAARPRLSNRSIWVAGRLSSVSSCVSWRNWWSWGYNRSTAATSPTSPGTNL